MQLPFFFADSCAHSATLPASAMLTGSGDGTGTPKSRAMPRAYSVAIRYLNGIVIFADVTGVNHFSVFSPRQRHIRMDMSPLDAGRTGNHTAIGTSRSLTICMYTMHSFIMADMWSRSIATRVPAPVD